MSVDALMTLLQTADYAGLTDAEVIAKANAKTETNSNAVTRHNYRDVLDAIKTVVTTPGGADGVVAAINAEIRGTPDDFVLNMLGAEERPNMADFASPRLRAALSGLATAGKITTQVRDALLALGDTTYSPFVKAGGTGLVDQTLLDAAKAKIAKVALFRDVAARYNAVVDAMNAGTITTLQAAYAALKDGV